MQALTDDQRASAAQDLIRLASEGSAVARRSSLVIVLATMPFTERRPLVELAVQNGAPRPPLEEALAFINPSTASATPVYKRGWFIGVVSALVGIGLGAGIVAAVKS